MNTHTNKAKAFSWDAFDEFFSTINIMKSQGQYQKLALDALQQIPREEDKARLINLLDLRLITLLELLQGHGDSYTDKSGALIFDDTIDARLQINNDICRSLGLSKKRADRLVGIIEQYESC
jgi:hypothetical protein